jgi:hypothetical protein
MDKTCCFCQGVGTEDTCGPLLQFKSQQKTRFVHTYCAYFAWVVWIDMSDNDEQFMDNFFICPQANCFPGADLRMVSFKLKNVDYWYSYTARLPCGVCKKSRAATGCAIGTCTNQYHFPCAEGNARFFYCSLAYIKVTPNV